MPSSKFAWNSGVSALSLGCNGASNCSVTVSAPKTSSSRRFAFCKPIIHARLRRILLTIGLYRGIAAVLPLDPDRNGSGLPDARVTGLKCADWPGEPLRGIMFLAPVPGRYRAAGLLNFEAVG